MSIAWWDSGPIGESDALQCCAAVPDLVLLDMRLPDIHGVDVCRRIKAAHPGIAILQTSAAITRPQDRARALDGGADGLDFYRLLARQASALLHQGGRLALEFGDGQAEAISSLLRGENWVVDAVVPDYTQRPRILVARRD